MTWRSFRDASDVERLQRFNASAIAMTRGCGYLHPGDIPYRLFNRNRWFQSAEVLTIWEDRGEVAAWVLVEPRQGAFDAQLLPELRGTPFDREVLEYANARTVELMRRHRIEGDTITTSAFRCDTGRSRLLVELGWRPNTGLPAVLNRRVLAALPEPSLPDGYRIRPAAGTSEAEKLAEVRAASFESEWTSELYRRVMLSPGYDPERELVVEARDGAIAAFVLTWHDDRNRTGLLESLGVHPDHLRRGLEQALVLAAMHRMAAAGLQFATVLNADSNEAARELYGSCGFRLWHLLDRYETQTGT